VNAAVLGALREDAVDVEAFDRRRKEPTHPVDQTAIPFSFTAYAFGCRASRRPIKTR